MNVRRAANAEHRFGSVHTLVKLDAIARYLPAYTTALKRFRFVLHYIDAFAGTGVCHIKIGQKRIMVPGSASIAMSCEPPFHHLVFIEAKLRRVHALRRLARAAQNCTISILQQDANLALPEYLDRLNQRRDRAVVFLDPYGMTVAWATLERIAASHLADVWYLFPLSALYRQAAIDAADIDEDKAQAITRIMGTDSWRQALYAPDPQLPLLDSQPKEVRIANTKQMLEWIKQRLEEIFPGVSSPKLLYQTFPSGSQGAPLFALFFAISNPDPKAVRLALKIAGDILKR